MAVLAEKNSKIAIAGHSMANNICQENRFKTPKMCITYRLRAAYGVFYAAKTTAPGRLKTANWQSLRPG